MCISREEMNKAMEEKQEWKRIKEQAEDNIAALDRKIIEFLEETEECEAEDKKGNPIRKFVGNVCKATLSTQTRETVNKEEVKKLLSDEDYKKVSKTSTYPVLRVV